MNSFFSRISAWRNTSGARYGGSTPWLVWGLIVAAPALGAGEAPQGLRMLPKAPRQNAAAPATTRNPQRVRDLLLAYHGTTKNALEAASSEVDAVLRDLIDDAGESLRVRRQAARALYFYPNEENFRFLEARVLDAPPGLQTRFLGTLAYFVAGREERVADLVRPLLGSSRVTVRHAAITLAKIVGPGRVRGALEFRLSTESDPAVRRELRRALGGGGG